MTWGTFGTTHIITLVLAALINIVLYFILKNKSRATQTAVLFLFSLSGIAAIIFNLVTWGSPIEYLPFHLCSLTAMVLPIAVLTRSKALSNLLLLWSLGALAALVMNQGQADYEIFSKTFFFYYFPHTFEFGIPILLFRLGLVKKDVKCIGSTLGITLAAYTVIHFINLAINSYCIENNVLDYAGNLIQVNYMYSITPSIPILQTFYNIIPHSYWYLLVAVPIILVYLFVIYLPDICKAIFKKKA
jgi:uncharacterized membrane protein YwaF